MFRTFYYIAMQKIAEIQKEKIQKVNIDSRLLLSLFDGLFPLLNETIFPVMRHDIILSFF